MNFLNVLAQINLDAETTGVLYKFLPPITKKEEADILRVFGANFPQDLLKLYRKCNGIVEYIKINGAWEYINGFIWTSTRAIEEYQNYVPHLPDMVFFADAGNGDCFCISKKTGTIHVWYPITDEVFEVAKTLDNFLEGWIVGEIKIYNMSAIRIY